MLRNRAFSDLNIAPRLAVWLRRSAVMCGLVGVALAPVNARACPAQISGAAATPVGAEVAYMASVIYWWNYYMYDLMDRLPRLANSEGANTESETRATTTNTDKIAIEETRLKMGETRSKLASEYVPATLTCSLASQQKRLAEAQTNYQDMRNRMTAASTNMSLGGPGSGTEKGAVQSVAKTFRDRCATYFDKDQIALPAAGLNCPKNPDPKMVNRDISPWTSIFQPINLEPIPAAGAWPPYTQAAYDTIKMLIEPSVPDHVKGPALARPEGQNIHVLRMRDLSRINLARGAMEDIVAKRIKPTAAASDGKQISRLARYIEMIAGQSVNGENVSGELNSVLNAGYMQNTQVQSIVGRLESQKMMLSEFLRFTEQMLAMQAVQLGIKVEETKAGGTTSASSVMKAK